ncbi:MAG: hypothetical protein OJF49_003969 [Ktedonobacterales bacterium]|jgi:hypothetical protein|nr:MAG: hypothetical protein OJF49_003969 [Ktedonobacterales bacterium]
MSQPTLALILLPELFAICRLPPDAPLPAWAAEVEHGDFVSITRTADELSIVCPQARVPTGVQAVSDYCCLKVEGPLDFALTGVMVALAAPLAHVGISVFAVATYDTDYLLIQSADLPRARAALTGAGHDVR